MKPAERAIASDHSDIALRTTSGNNTEYVIDLPLDKLIKCNFVVHKSSRFYPEVALQETLYDDYWSVV